MQREYIIIQRSKLSPRVSVNQPQTISEQESPSKHLLITLSNFCTYCIVYEGRVETKFVTHLCIRRSPVHVLY
jgi:hypothetical protein